MLWGAAHGATLPHAAAFLDQTEAMRRIDHGQFEQRLAQLHRDEAQLSPEQRWHLRYLDGWDALYDGNNTRAGELFREVIGHAGDKAVVAKASALLLSQLSIARRYDDVFELANRLTNDLPTLHDAQARYLVLLNLSQAMGLAMQTDLAVHYARLAAAALPPGETACLPLVMQVEALDAGRRLSLSSGEPAQAIAACKAARESVLVNTVQLIVAGLWLDHEQPRKALVLLRSIGPGIRASHYFGHEADAQAELARAYAVLGNDTEAGTAALAVLAMYTPGETSTWLRDACGVLYRTAKKQGHADVALKYYEQYVAQDRSYLDDLSARTLAYETVQQHVLAQRLETEQLARQNASLRLQQQLAAKTAEANRLYIALLALALGFGVFVMVRLKRSQLRYRRLSRLDGLTELLNRQHFMGDAELVLQRLHKRGGETCLAYLDLDHFKRINDTHGHAAGDAVLRDVVAVCRQQLRSLDLFGRLGGEEFGILLVDTSREQAWAIAGRIRQAVAASPVAFGEDRIAVSVSIGLACADSSGHDLQRLCMDADAALYLAKDSGRNCVVADGGGAGLNQRTPTSSTSKISTASGGMSSPSPRLP